MKIENKVVAVVGGASGLGRAVCDEFAAAESRVVVVDRDGDAARRVAAGLSGALAVQADITCATSMEQAVETILEAFGALHVDVNTAGVVTAAKLVSRGRPAELSPFAHTVGINLIGTFNAMRVSAAAMLRNELDDGERGVIVNTASGAAFEGQSGQAAYSASKAGIVGLTLPVARDLAGTGIRVNAIAPGLFDTPMSAGLPDPVRDGLLESVLEPKRLGRPNEFARLVRHLVENEYLNGECVRLDAATRLLPR
ncbi:SDR family NAD(P)-dependent oxidoreductase [[Mycobacterium] burgundiense]|uniref:SDR family NAD(P)-dependent oxidoreductase n=1 Tax=[Mycobacterium] burgundiense TaxID=3064286 RepID=A0ABM9LUD8_9MYCO|nr:SDR family NAD(P)-dependent oxidoreductase [Mycolicibacterium sp. MU0053]CAJ1504894.1 SDR family NAD(P)-dependent oxidoreductase [Mycolicibacterium sp. MU0053]